MLEIESEKKARSSRLEYKSFTTWILLLSFTISFTTLIIYLAEVNFNDRTLFIMLIILRYSSFMICLCSLHKIIMHLYGVLRRYKFRLKKFAIFLGFFLYGVGIILLEAFVAAVSGGNG